MSTSTETEVGMDTEQDLRDVFRLMYDDEDWTIDEDDHPPLDSLVPDVQLENIKEVEDDFYFKTYSRKRFRAQLDALLPSSTITKKRRIFEPSPRITYYSSTNALPALPSPKSFEPYNPLSYLARLRTFHPSLYSPFLPISISPEKLARNGWFCSSRDGVECACGGKFGVGGLVDIGDGRVREEIGRRLGEGMRGRHQRGCGWGVLSCPDDIMSKLRNILHIPTALNISTLSSTLPSLDNLPLKSQLSEKQLNNLTFALSRYTTSNPIQAELAFFGWAPHPLSTEIVSCRICQRRLGFWAFTCPSASEDHTQERDVREREGLDPVAEHISWCPLGIEAWWDSCALLKGGRGNIGDVGVSKMVKRRKWIKG